MEYMNAARSPPRGEPAKSHAFLPRATPRWARINSLPIQLAAPWGLMIGPACALPYLPLPTKVTVTIGEPISSPIPPTLRDNDVELQAEKLYGTVEGVMQGLLDDMYAERSLPIIG